jgi:NAD/NADP transhydrogenase beta subunit
MTENPIDWRVIRAAPDLLEALMVIVANAVIQPDAKMNGSTDIYAVPIEDIDAARAAIAKAKGEKE